LSWLPYALSAWIFCVGLYGIVRSRNLIHLAVCVSVVQSSTYVLLLSVGYKKGGTAPVFTDIPFRRTTVDPVVQALTLTDIVVSVVVFGLLLTLAIESFRNRGTLDPAELADLQG
jgi:multicomponent Na+:H+ antiporter subunit C